MRAALVVAGMAVLGGALFFLSRDPAESPGASLERRAVEKEPAPTDSAVMEPVEEDDGPAASDSSRRTVETDPEPEHAAPASSTPTLKERVDEVSASFLTDDPDLEGLEELWIELAPLARVDPESIAVDAFGYLKASITFEGTDLTAQLRREDGWYHVELPASVPADGPFLMGEVRLMVEDADSLNVGSIVQFHPNTGGELPAELRDGGEAYVGWTVTESVEGRHAQPITMRAGPNGWSWRIGKPGSEEFTPIRQEWEWGVARYQPWADLLRGLE